MNEIVIGSALFTAIVVALALIIIGARRMLMPAMDVTVTVNGEKAVPAITGQKLLMALNDGGVPVPSGCAGAGTCGLCRVIIKIGGGETLPTELAKLSPSEVHEGTRLACQVTIRNAINVQVPEGILGAANWLCTVSSTRMLSPLIKEIVLDLPEGEDVEFRAGTFVQITAPPYEIAFSQMDIAPAFNPEWEHLQLKDLTAHSTEPVTRAYSIANRPEDEGTVVLNIRLAVPPPEADGIPPGIVSSWLFNLRENDVVEVAGPYGDFGAQESEREMVFIGGGVGIAPLRAIIFDQLERVGTKRKISFWYGARSRHDIFYAEEFDDLARRYENFSWTVALSEPRRADIWDGAEGFIHDVVYRHYLKDHAAPEDCEYYLCGPPLMIDTVLAMLDEIGVEGDSIFNDDFGG